MASSAAKLFLAVACAAASAANVAINANNVTNPAVSKRWLGCHSDPGYTQEPRGWMAEMLYGNAFEQGTMAVPSWNILVADGVNGGFESRAGTSFNGNPSMGLYAKNGDAQGINAAVTNRGMGNEGLYLEGGKNYEGYLWVWPNSKTTLIIALRDYTTNATLSSVTIDAVPNGVPWGETWQKLPFNLTALTAGTACTSIVPGSNPTIDCGGHPSDAHICAKCGGEFVVGIIGTGDVSIGYVSLKPGAWGRFDANTRADAVANLRAMGTNVIRQGGSVSQSFRWKDWMNPQPEYRQASGHVWGDSLVSPWGPFEFIDMCNGAGIEPIVTLAYDLNSPRDWADLVEYAWGDNTTYWGSLRIVDHAHPAPYNITVFELGNEQYNPSWVDQVAAMEARRIAIGAPELHYMFPENTGLNAADAQRAMDLGLPITRIMPDIHVGAGGAVQAAEGLFASPPVPGFNQSAINCETNAATHDMQRALDEASDLITWFNAPLDVASRLYARTASFCTERSGHFDGFDQGISFFLPNMTWLQPPGYVHAMISSTWGQATLQSTVTNTSTVVASAQLSADGSTLIVRAVNQAGVPDTLTLNLAGASLATGAQAAVSTLSGPQHGDNTPSQPTLIAPQASTVKASSASTASVPLPAYSFVVASFPLA